jgi:hypothetical protein
MLQVKRSLLVFSMLLFAACNAITQLFQATQIPAPTPTALEITDTPLPPTATVAPTATATLTQVQTDTPVPVPTEPPTTATAASLIDAYSVTMMAEFGSMGALMNVAQYFNPVGTPVQNWHNIPIMSQAIAGQEFKTNVYSYTASATLAQARQFYESKAGSLGLINSPGTGYSGTGNNASHNVDFISPNVSIVLTSFDNDTGHVIVVLSTAQ